MRNRLLCFAIVAMLLCGISGCDSAIELTFVANVRGAVLYIDGEEMGPLPLTVKVPAGEKELEVRPPASLQGLLSSWSRTTKVEGSDEFQISLLGTGVNLGHGSKISWTRSSDLMFIDGDQLVRIPFGFDGREVIALRGEPVWYWAEGDMLVYLLDDGYYYRYDNDARDSEILPYSAMFADSYSEMVAGLVSNSKLELLHPEGGLIGYEINEGEFEYALVDSTGNYLLYVLKETDVYRLYLAALDGQDSIEIAKSTTPITDIQFAPTSNYFTWLADDGRWFRPSQGGMDMSWKGWHIEGKGVQEAAVMWVGFEDEGEFIEGYMVGGRELGRIEALFDAYYWEPSFLFPDLVELNQIGDYGYELHLEQGSATGTLIKFLDVTGKQTEGSSSLTAEAVYPGDWRPSHCQRLLAYSYDNQGDRTIRVRWMMPFYFEE